MSNKDRDKQRRSDLKSLPTEVLLKARSTLVSLGGAWRSKNDSPRSKQKQDLKGKKNPERLKNCRSEPEFSDMRKPKHRSRIDDLPREYENRAGPRPRPLSVGAMKRYESDLEFHCGNYPKEFESSDDICVQSRLVIPVNERLNQDVQMQEVNERPRKKLSFREPEIIGSATLGRSSKLMGVNSLSRRPNRLSLRTDVHPHFDGMDLDLESQAMKIVRTVGQAFEVCHKMQTNTPDNPVASTSASDAVTVDHINEPTPKEPASECGASESGASTSKAAEEKIKVNRPKNLDLLPPPPRKDGKRGNQTIPSINLPDLPECITKVDVSVSEGEAATPLSAQHQLQLLRERLEQQAQQTQAAVAQLLLLRDQLAAEQAARCEAQARTHQLLVHNKELLEHIAALVSHLQEKEKGNSRPISAQQLTLLPQNITGSNEAIKTENVTASNGNYEPFNTNALISFITKNNNNAQNVENNNISLSTLSISPTTEKLEGSSSAPNFENMNNEQIQSYLISKFQDMNFTNGIDPVPNTNKQFFQNSRAFPHIPPLKNNFSNSDLVKLLNNQIFKENLNSDEEVGAIAQAMSLAQSQNSLYSTSQSSTSKESSSPDDISSDDGASFIMPLSHNGTLAATGNDGRLRLIVPVSPSESASEVVDPQVKEEVLKGTTGMTLKVPGANHSLAPPAPITRSTSEKVPNRSEMMTALRSQWTRHTTK